MNKHGGFNSNKKNFSKTNIKFKRNPRASTILEAAKYSGNYSFNKFRFMQADKFCYLSLNRIYEYRIIHFSMIICIDSFCDYTIDLIRFNGGRNIGH